MRHHDVETDPVNVEVEETAVKIVLKRCSGSTLGSQPREPGFHPGAEWKNLGGFSDTPHAPVHLAVSRYVTSGKEL